MRDASLPLAAASTDFSSICRFSSSVGSRAVVTSACSSWVVGTSSWAAEHPGQQLTPDFWVPLLLLCSSGTSGALGVHFPYKLLLRLK